MSNLPTLHLYTYFRSSCTARIRTACQLKGLGNHLTYTYINLLQDAQSTPAYKSTNPSASVPTLTVTFPSRPENKIIIRQSIAILEFLDEYFPDTVPLLPPKDDVAGRAHVRELISIIASDTQPVTNLRILRRVEKLGGDKGAWAKDLMEEGLKAYDAVAEKYAGKYSVGDEVTMADVCLAPAVEGALRYGVNVEGLGTGTVWRIYEAVRGLEAFRKGDWRHQADTPGEFRVEE
jgi:maleylacetoacetate isomerase